MYNHGDMPIALTASIAMSAIAEVVRLGQENIRIDSDGFYHLSPDWPEKGELKEPPRALELGSIFMITTESAAIAREILEMKQECGAHPYTFGNVLGGVLGRILSGAEPLAGPPAAAANGSGIRALIEQISKEIIEPRYAASRMYFNGKTIAIDFVMREEPSFQERLEEMDEEDFLQKP